MNLKVSRGKLSNTFRRVGVAGLSPVYSDEMMAATVPDLSWISQNMHMGNPLDFDVERVLANVRRSPTPDLISRITVFREGMEPKAIQLIESELSNRGVEPEEIEAYGEKLRREMLVSADGLPVRCSFCHQPAVTQSWDWHRIWGRIPVFPRTFYYCAEHRPDSPQDPAEEHPPEAE
jgi:hypothetical protein